MRGRPTKDPYTRPAINTLERLHAELGGKILENRQQAENRPGITPDPGGVCAIIPHQRRGVVLFRSSTENNSGFIKEEEAETPRQTHKS